MTIEFHCTKCEQPLSAPDENAGQKMRCQYCGTTLDVPTPHDFLWPPGAAPPKPPPAAKPVAPPAAKAPPKSPPPKSSAAAVPVARAMRVVLPGQSGVTNKPPAAAPAQPVAPPAKPVSAKPPGAKPPPLASPVAAPAQSDTVDDLGDMLTDDEWAPKKTLPSVGEPAVDELAAGKVPQLGGSEPRAPRTIEVKNVLSRTWRLYKSNLGVLVGTAFLMMMTSSALSWVVSYGVAQTGLGSQDVLETVHSSIPAVMRPWVVIMLILYVPQLLLIPITLGGMSVIAAVARGRKATFEDAVVGGAPLMAALVVWLICFLPHSILTAALIEQRVSPGWVGALSGWTLLFLFALVWFPSLLFVSDQSGPLEAIVGSLRLWASNVFALVVLAFTSAALLVASVLPCGLGVPFVVPFVLLLFTVAYTTVHRA